MNKGRRFDLDWLRVCGVFLVVIFHTMMIFILEPWAVVYIKDTEYIHCFRQISNFIHVFNMPLMFVIAGMAVKISLESRSVGQFIKERCSRLLLPAAFGCIFLNPIMTFLYRTSPGENKSFLEHYIGFFTKDPGDLAGLKGGFTPAHFWFILFLLIYSLAILPLIPWLKGFGTERAKSIIKILSRPYMLLLMAIPVAVTAAINILDDKNPLTYFLMFLTGYFIMVDDTFRMAINRDKWGYLVLGTACSVTGILFGDSFSAWTVPWILISFAMQLARIAMVFALLGIGNCFLNRDSKILRYLSKASFPIYMIHLLISTATGYLVINLSIKIPGIQKFFLVLLMTMVLSVLFYEMIKRIRILSVLFGIKYKK